MDLYKAFECMVILGENMENTIARIMGLFQYSDVLS